MMSFHISNADIKAYADDRDLNVAVAQRELEHDEVRDTLNALFDWGQIPQDLVDILEYMLEKLP